MNDINEKSKLIDIDPAIAHLVPKEFKSLKKSDSFVLVKTEHTRKGYAFVVAGDRVRGTLSIVNIVDKPGVKVVNNDRGSDYIRTSPIVKVVDSTKDSITFQTEGGTYHLVRE